MKLNEAETRLQHIDPALAAAGWITGGSVRVRAEFQITDGRILGGGQRGAAQKADYLLEYKGQYLAVVEAKAWDAPYTEGVGQAKEYALKLGVRFTFATNGQQIYMIDMKEGTERDVDAFPTPEELWDLTFGESDEWRDKFGEVPLELKGGQWSTRYYQEIAVNSVLEAIISGQDRILLTLATGTGKTSIAFQIAWKLFQTRWNLRGDGKQRPRILFLADRNVLANQAYNEFSAFPEDALVRIDPASIRKKGQVPMNANVFFTIFQTFMTENGGEANFGEYPPDFFDFIIVDECHRGGANDESTWRAILDYFAPAVQLGLTATPKRDDNVDTYEYFGKPVFIYSLKDGIADGFLTPFRVRRIDTTLDDYTYVSDDDVVEGEIEPGKVYIEDDFNTTIEIAEREKYRVNLFLDEINQDEKTIVFCANQAHALMIRDLINQHATSTNPSYCQRVTADEGDIGDQTLKAFQDNEKTIPTILTTSKKLSTGVNARNIRNIILLRPIKSMIEFKQVIGRGTRLYEGKDYFTVYDFVDAHTHFQDPDWDGEPQDPEPRPEKPERPKPPIVDGGQDEPGDEPEGRKKKIKVKLADGKERTIQHMSETMFLGADGNPMSAPEFIRSLFETLKLPEFFDSEEKLREIWSDPTTRKRLLERLTDVGFGADDLKAIQTLISAETSDLFDVLEYVAFANPPVTRARRAEVSRLTLVEELSPGQMEFIDFVLSKYVEAGSEELDNEKLPILVELKYSDFLSGVKQLGGPEEARVIFVDFQKHLYKPAAEYEMAAA
jgi:type I restriction enzyme R subunit